MTELLIRLFVPNREETTDPAVRGRYGTVAGLVGIACNLLLFIGKVIIGLLSASISIVADAVNNLSDAASSIMTLMGFRLASKPADAEHPYGHARFEYLSGLGVAALILMIGFQMVKSSVGKILHPEPVSFSWALCAVLIVSIGLKLWMAHFNRTIGKRIGSTTLEATAADSRNDVISTSGVLVSAVIAHFSGLQLDGYVGLAVALFIIYSGIGIGKETLRPLIGSPTDPELLDWLRRETMDYHPCILGVHDIIVHDYGPGRRFASLHAEIPHTEDVLLAHEVLDGVERMFRLQHGIELVIHYDPVVTDDEELNAMRKTMLHTLESIDESLGAHDFRLVRGKGQTNLIFDVVLPYHFSKREEEVLTRLEQAAKSIDDTVHTIVTCDYHGLRPDFGRKPKQEEGEVEQDESIS